jgi:hypothetical protein
MIGKPAVAPAFLHLQHRQHDHGERKGAGENIAKADIRAPRNNNRPSE